MSCCNCGQPERLCRCPKGKGGAPKRAYIAECTDCDPCRPCESMVKICSFVAPTLTEGQRFRNSFIYNQEDDSVYYIDDAGTPTRFGSSPMFIDNFNPNDRKIPRQTVFDFANNKAYIYDPEGNYITVDLAGDSDNKLRVTMDYGDTDDWHGSSAGDVGLDFGWDEQESVGYKIDAMSVQDPTFTDEKTGHVYTAGDIIDLLNDGVDIIFDNVPLGYLEEDADEDTITVRPIDGLSFTAKTSDPAIQDAPVYTGTAAVMLGFGQGTFAPLCFAFIGGFTINQQPDEDVTYPPQFVVQGVYHRRPSV